MTRAEALCDELEKDPALWDLVFTTLLRKGLISEVRRTTRGDFLLEEHDDLDCGLCLAHEGARQELAGVVCPNPYCDGVLHLGGDENLNLTMEAVGETNISNAEGEPLVLALIGSCPKCSEPFALFPFSIMYNANHDVYYTGGSSYVPCMDENSRKTLRETFKPKIENWYFRKQQGEKLRASDLALWLERDAAHFVAETLYIHGDKK